MSLKRAAEEYFSTINPIATRLCQDMKEIVTSYEDLWSTLSEDEQKQIITESIIKPEVCLKYSNIDVNKIDSDYAVKLVIDENCSYRDEHSGPFSFRTQSQRNLNIFGKEVPLEAQKEIKPIVSKKTPMTEPKTIPENALDDAQNNVPKTGLDFLDNW